MVCVPCYNIYPKVYILSMSLPYLIILAIVFSVVTKCVIFGNLLHTIQIAFFSVINSNFMMKSTINSFFRTLFAISFPAHLKALHKQVLLLVSSHQLFIQHYAAVHFISSNSWDYSSWLFKFILHTIADKLFTWFIYLHTVFMDFCFKHEPCSTMNSFRIIFNLCAAPTICITAKVIIHTQLY